jgi:PAS domain S-box-containing protein
MKKYLYYFCILTPIFSINAGMITFLNKEDGHTNWQHLANWSGGIFIILLSITAVMLFVSRRQAHQSNRALKEIRNQLEQRVLERTATLDQYNQLLKDSNRLLEGEITQHKTTTERLRSSESYIADILSSMPLMLISLDQHGKITRWNQKTESITGISSAQALGKDLWHTYPAITITPAQIIHAQTQNQATTIKHSQRGQYHFDITIYPLRGQEETGVVILIDDVTKNILAANMLIQRDKISSMGELASTMAHDISFPLQCILEDLNKGLSSIEKLDLLKNKDGTGVKSLLLNANQRGQQVMAIIDNLVDFSISQGGKKQLGAIPSIINNTLDLARKIITSPSGLKFCDIKVEIDYEENLPQIPFFSSEMKQVILSLFRHACYAISETMPKKSEPLIKIKVMECYEALWVKIQHNGLGVSKEEQQFIFEPFFTNQPTSCNYDSTKRLSFSYFIITEQHKGQLAITSDLDVGTTFHIQLPLSRSVP